MMELDLFLAQLAGRRTDEVVVTTMGSVRPWARHSTSAGLDFASADSAMGHAADLALGIALARPDRAVLCLNGDGSMLMTLGTLVTLAATDANLALFVICNQTYEITGNQPLPGAGRTDFVTLARGAGLTHSWRLVDPDDCALLDEILATPGPRLAAVDVQPGDEGPLSRGSHNPEAYLQPSLAESAHGLRELLAQPRAQDPRPKTQDR